MAFMPEILCTIPTPPPEVDKTRISVVEEEWDGSRGLRGWKRTILKSSIGEDIWRRRRRKFSRS
ncbi:UNVERIFIED_CONTAM: hypothetical protein Sradi_1504700 [Sesamum radiatum]|uniref:Uncharacterized protein n=1 Tax=Sesamum radiatum TaxID=300843 RepID=A0AAW2U7W4_SESRA